MNTIGKTERAGKCFEKAHDLNPGYVQRFLSSRRGGGDTFLESSRMRAKEDEDGE